MASPSPPLSLCLNLIASLCFPLCAAFVPYANRHTSIFVCVFISVIGIMCIICGVSMLSIDLLARNSTYCGNFRLLLTSSSSLSALRIEYACASMRPWWLRAPMLRYPLEMESTTPVRRHRPRHRHGATTCGNSETYSMALWGVASLISLSCLCLQL